MKKIRDFLKKLLAQKRKDLRHVLRRNRAWRGVKRLMETVIFVIATLKKECKDMNKGLEQRAKILKIKFLEYACSQMRYELLWREWSKRFITKVLEKEYKKLCYEYGWHTISSLPIVAPKYMCKFLPLTDDGGIIFSGIRYEFIKPGDWYARAYWNTENTERFVAINLYSLLNGIFDIWECYLASDIQDTTKKAFILASGNIATRKQLNCCSF